MFAFRQPAAGASLPLLGEPHLFGTAALDGAFELDGLTPGNYLLTLDERAPSGAFVSGSASVEISAADEVREVRMRLSDQ